MAQETTFDEMKLGDVFIALAGSRAHTNEVEGLCVGKLFMRAPYWESGSGSGNAIEFCGNLCMGSGISILEAAQEMTVTDLYDVEMKGYWSFTEGCGYQVLHLGNIILSTVKGIQEEE